MTQLETVAARHLARLVDPPIADPGEVDLDADLADEYGMTSLTTMLLITSICDDLDLDLSAFSDEDIATLRTTQDILRRLGGAEKVDA